MIAAGASTAVAAVGSVFNFLGTQAAHHQAVGAANLNYNEQSAQIGQENVQLGQQQGEQQLSDAVKQARDFGMIANSASSMGFGASTSHQLLSATAAGYNRTMGIEDLNYDNKRAGLQTDLTGASIQRSTAIAQAPRTNLGILALNLASNATGGASTYGQLGGRFGVPAAGAPSPSPPGGSGFNADGSMFFG